LLLNWLIPTLQRKKLGRAPPTTKPSKYGTLIFKIGQSNPRPNSARTTKPGVTLIGKKIFEHHTGSYSLDDFLAGRGRNTLAGCHLVATTYRAKQNLSNWIAKKSGFMTLNPDSSPNEGDGV
jgi:hypothetical protein